jgi:hypothetical protein
MKLHIHEVNIMNNDAPHYLSYFINLSTGSTSMKSYHLFIVLKNSDVQYFYLNFNYFTNFISSIFFKDSKWMIYQQLIITESRWFWSISNNRYRAMQIH